MKAVNNINNVWIIAYQFSFLFIIFGCSNSSDTTLNREGAILGFEGSSTHLVQNTMYFARDTMVYKVKYLTNFPDYDKGAYQRAACSNLNDILYKDYESAKAEFRTQFKIKELKVNVVRLELTTFSGKKFICDEIIVIR
jgi:hypothetical protein